jgi:hypothetical protein
MQQVTERAFVRAVGIDPHRKYQDLELDRGWQWAAIDFRDVTPTPGAIFAVTIAGRPVIGRVCRHGDDYRISGLALPLCASDDRWLGRVLQVGKGYGQCGGL